MRLNDLYSKTPKEIETIVNKKIDADCALMSGVPIVDVDERISHKSPESVYHLLYIARGYANAISGYVTFYQKLLNIVKTMREIEERNLDAAIGKILHENLNAFRLIKSSDEKNIMSLHLVAPLIKDNVSLLKRIESRVFSEFSGYKQAFNNMCDTRGDLLTQTTLLTQSVKLGILDRMTNAYTTQDTVSQDPSESDSTLASLEGRIPL